MKTYHRTPFGQRILKEGFKDGEGTYLTLNVYRGVWISNVPLDINEGAEGDDLIEIKLPARIFREYEWIEEGKPYRESLLPASILNRYPARLIDESEEEKIYKKLREKYRG